MNLFNFKLNIINVFRIHYFLYWGSISAVLNYNVLFITEHAGVGQKETGKLIIFPVSL